uniref:Uncharacterized protein n=1 Tax=Oryza meridionalis TaxID=40149 RepID=A0A0E0C4R4_9ORYZ
MDLVSNGGSNSSSPLRFLPFPTRLPSPLLPVATPSTRLTPHPSLPTATRLRLRRRLASPRVGSAAPASVGRWARRPRARAVGVGALLGFGRFGRARRRMGVAMSQTNWEADKMDKGEIAELGPITRSLLSSQT